MLRANYDVGRVRHICFSGVVQLTHHPMNRHKTLFETKCGHNYHFTCLLKYAVTCIGSRPHACVACPLCHANAAASHVVQSNATTKISDRLACAPVLCNNRQIMAQNGTG